MRLITTLLCCLAFVLPCAADSMWDYQRVNSVGYGAHPIVWADETNPDSRVTIEGIALAGYNEILDPSSQYTVFLQDDTSDRGGMQAWTGKFFYGEPLWSQLRLSDYINFQAGQRLRITGLLADMGRGKVVMNNRGHNATPNLIWHVEIIGNPGLPDPELIPTISNCNHFDQTRADGGERYQTRYTMLHGIEISSGTWGNNNLMTISDPTGSVGMLLSAVGDFNSNPQPTGKLNVVGIFDQEDDQVSPYTDGYRIWVKRMSDIALALDGCREVRSRNIGERVALVNKVVSRIFDGYFYIQDPDRSGGVKIVSDRKFKPGDVICAQGVIDLIADEKVIIPTYLSAGSLAPKPVFVTSPTLWGDDGLDVDGLLVRVFATVGSNQGGGVYSLTDDDGRTIYADVNSAAMPAQGTRVAITGVATQSNGSPLLLVANKGDIQAITE